MSAAPIVLPEKLDIRTLRWLIIAQIAVVIPHLPSLPAWLIALVVVLTGWRYSSFHGYGTLPGPVVRALLVAGGVGLMYSTYQIKFTVEAAVAFFALTYALKVLEVRQRRDLYLFIFLSFFLLALKFLFDQTLWTSLYVVGAVGVCLVGLVVIVNPASDRRAGKLAVKLVLQAIPLVLVAYLLFPRMAPLWSVPLTTEKNWTGISDRINPGDISDLAQNSARAFRVSFDGAVPQQEELYFRGLILDHYEGGEWRVSDLRRWRAAPAGRAGGPSTPAGLSYEIIQEPTGKPWGFALENPQRIAGDFQVDLDGLVRFRMDLIHPTRYRVGTGEQAQSVSLTEQERRQYLKLPAGENPVTRAWISQFGAKYDNTNDLAWALMRYFREQPFFYTLRPPQHGADQVDEFLFQTQRGFCAHFAGAFTFALRAAGVPARMVLGYQGGEWNAEGGYLMVHQYDAHAWVEVWLDGEGWTRFDPTAMVAPNRIEQGIREAMAAEGSFLEEEPFSLGRYNNLGVARWLRMSMDRANYNWQRWVVQYDEETQLQFFKRWYEQIDLRLLGLWLASLVGGLVFIALGWLLWSERKRPAVDPVTQSFLLFEQRLARFGLRREPGETPRAFAQRAVARFPRSASLIASLHKRLETLMYRRSAAARAGKELKAIRRDIRRLRPE